MSPEAQRIAIAEACGWAAYGNTWKSPCESKYARIVDRRGAIELIPDSDILPDYLGSLDAINEAEMTLCPHHQFEYAKTLMEIAGSIFATAPQRAEAFLRTIGKWTPTP